MNGRAAEAAYHAGLPVSNWVLKELRLAMIKERLWRRPASMMLFVMHTRETLHLTVDTQEGALSVVRNSDLNGPECVRPRFG